MLIDMLSSARPQAQAPLRRSQLLAQELAHVQREAQQQRSGSEAAEEAAVRRSELVRRLRRRLDRLQAQLEASTVEVGTAPTALESARAFRLLGLSCALRLGTRVAQKQYITKPDRRHGMSRDR